MKEIVLSKQKVITGRGSLEKLSEFSGKRVMIVTGGQSMFRTGVIAKAESILEKNDCKVRTYSGISKNPTTTQILLGLEDMKLFRPEVVVAVGGGSPIDAAKVMTLFYDYPEFNFENVFGNPDLPHKLNTIFVAVPSTSGTASEVTQVSVVTLAETREKKAIKTEAIRPDIAILDADLPDTLPKHIVAETGMDALTHALEAYINKNGNDFTDALAKEAIEGLLQYLLPSYIEGDALSREKVHNYQCMAGMAFSNSGLGMVHGVSHAFGGIYDMAHGLANAIILPYSMDYNKKDQEVKEKYNKLSGIIGKDIIDAVRELQRKLDIPDSFMKAGIPEADYQDKFDRILAYSMKGSTAVNPIKVSEEDMKRFVNCVYYGTKVDF